MDVTDEASVAHGFGTLHGRVKNVNVLVNNAGVGGGEVVQGSDVARWKQTHRHEPVRHVSGDAADPAADGG